MMIDWEPDACVIHNSNGERSIAMWPVLRLEQDSVLNKILITNYIFLNINELSVFSFNFAASHLSELHRHLHYYYYYYYHHYHHYDYYN
jgi:hypothetical protein